MKQKYRLLKLVKRNQGLTATGYSKLMGCTSVYKPATILKELHRFVNAGVLIKRQEPGMVRGMAWRFYVPEIKV